MELRDAWDEVEGRMQQDSEEQPGTVLPGLIELQALLGEQVQGVGTLHLAKERSQARLTQACWRAAERKWRKMGDRIDGHSCIPAESHLRSASQSSQAV